MNLTTSQIKEILESPEDVSPKCLAIIIADMTERIEYIERCYMDLYAKHSILEDEYNSLTKCYAKLHLNSKYGMAINEADVLKFKQDKNFLKEIKHDWWYHHMYYLSSHFNNIYSRTDSNNLSLQIRRTDNYWWYHHMYKE